MLINISKVLTRSSLAEVSANDNWVEFNKGHYISVFYYFFEQNHAICIIERQVLNKRCHFHHQDESHSHPQNLHSTH